MYINSDYELERILEKYKTNFRGLTKYEYLISGYRCYINITRSIDDELFLEITISPSRNHFYLKWNSDVENFVRTANDFGFVKGYDLCLRRPNNFTVQLENEFIEALLNYVIDNRMLYGWKYNLK